MANVTTTGLDELIKNLTHAASSMDEAVDEMLTDGGDVIRQEWKSAIRTSHPHASDRLSSSVTSMRKVDKNGVKYVVVYPKGSHPTSKDKKGKPMKYAAIAFILNYGRKNMVGSRFVNRAVEKSTPKVEKKAQQIFEKYLQKEGLI